METNALTATFAWFGGGPGVQELILILGIFVLLFGARKIPELARSVGKGITEFKRGLKEPGSEEPKESKEIAEEKTSEHVREEVAKD